MKRKDRVPMTPEQVKAAVDRAAAASESGRRTSEVGVGRKADEALLATLGKPSDDHSNGPRLFLGQLKFYWNRFREQEKICLNSRMSLDKAQSELQIFGNYLEDTVNWIEKMLLDKNLFNRQKLLEACPQFDHELRNPFRWSGTRVERIGDLDDPLERLNTLKKELWDGATARE